jgi:hypothetical protein
VSITPSLVEDAYEGDAEFTVAVDGQHVGGTQTATVLRRARQRQTITLDEARTTDLDTVLVAFINDLYGGNASSLDRSLNVGPI